MRALPRLLPLRSARRRPPSLPLRPLAPAAQPRPCCSPLLARSAPPPPLPARGYAAAAAAAAAQGRQRRRRNSRRNRRPRERPLSPADAASRELTRTLSRLIAAGEREAAWSALREAEAVNVFHCTAMVAGCADAAQLEALRRHMAAAGVAPNAPFLSALHARCIEQHNPQAALATLAEGQQGRLLKERRWRGLATAGLQQLLASGFPSRAQGYLALLADAGLARKPPRYRCHLGCILLKTAAVSLRTGAEHFNCVISAAADTPEDESQVGSLLAAMEAAGVER